MNKQKAEEAGLRFTGHYSSDHEAIKEVAKRERREKPLATIRLIRERPSKLARNPRTGWSLYASEEYEAYRTLERNAGEATRHENEIRRLEAKHEAEMYEAKVRHEAIETQITEAKKTLENAQVLDEVLPRSSR